MKKFLAVCIIGLSLGAANVFADHPDGWGIGIFGRGGFGWGSGAGGGDFGLSLKAPMLPIFWGLSFSIGSSYVGVGVTGDYYIIDKPLLSDIKLHWYLGVGGYIGFQHWSFKGAYWEASWTYIDFGVRLPIGLSWQPLDFLEVFAAVVPSLGLYIDTDGTWKDTSGTEHKYHEGGLGLGGGIGFELGIRFWF